MTRRRLWQFDPGDRFDGRDLYARSSFDPGGALPRGTLEIVFASDASRRGVLLARGVPARDPGAFVLALTGQGGSVLRFSDPSGQVRRLRAPEGLVTAGARMQATLCWGERCSLTLVDLDRIARDPHDPGAGVVMALPPGLALWSAPLPLWFGAASGAAPPFFGGRIVQASLSDSIDAPTVALPGARVHRLFPHRPLGMVPNPRGGMADDRPAPSTVPDPLVATVGGARPLGSVRPGDRVPTRDHGEARVLSTLRVDTAAAAWPYPPPRLVRAGSVAPGLPRQDLVLGSFQRISRGQGPTWAEPVPGLAHHHLLFDRTVAIRLGGLWVEMIRPSEMPQQAGSVVAFPG